MKALAAVLFSILPLLPAPASAAALGGKITVFPQTAFLLPVTRGLKLQWVSQPLKPAARTRFSQASYHFDVDPRGNPWFGNGEKSFFLNPRRNFALLIDVPYDGFVWLDGGDFLICAGKSLGSLDLSKKTGKQKNGIPVVRFKPVIKLPEPARAIFSGGKAAAYLLWKDPETGHDVLSLIEHRSGENPKADKLVDSDGPIGAVAGDGRTTYFSVGRWIFRLKPGESKPRPFYTPKETVTGLSYSAAAGLFYATPSSVGFADPKLQLKLLASPNPEIALQGDALYIRLARTLGVIRIAGVSRLRKLSRD